MLSMMLGSLIPAYIQIGFNFLRLKVFYNKTKYLSVMPRILGSYPQSML